MELSPWLLETAKENMGGLSVQSVFGRNSNAGPSPEDIWDGGGIWTPPAFAQQHNIASTSASDRANGNGARAVEIFGLDADFNEQTERLRLNGQANVLTSGSYIRINKMSVFAVGADGINHGNITATAEYDDTVTAQISASFNQTLMAIYTLAASKEGHLINYHGNINRRSMGSSDILLKVQPIGSVYKTIHILGGIDGDSYICHYFPLLKVEQKSDIKLTADVSGSGTDISAGFELMIVDI